MWFRWCLAAAVLAVVSIAPCPFAAGRSSIDSDRKIESNRNDSRPVVDYTLVADDIEAALTKSMPFWPADFGNYGPLLIRLAWHCSGSYRQSDGRGGCDGARIRFNPERSWPDNTNLDKALKIIQPIKVKYGSALSWGDLIVLAGNVAIKSMGGPVLGFCGGRQDDKDGESSLQLGPTPEQDAIVHCETNGNCSYPLGPNTIGLIYVNPEGPMGKPDPVGSATGIRNVFSRMGFNDEQTVALIGGGHSFGKTHGACPTGPGPNPTERPDDPWPGTCGEGQDKGKGNNTFTSGFEGPWTTAPTNWTNEYFSNLLEYQWTPFTGPGNHVQWQPNAPRKFIRMLTSDIALLNDNSYLSLVKEYRSDIVSLGTEFAKAWYQLTTSDMGPATRCLGSDVPAPQAFQNPLPAPSENITDFKIVREVIMKNLYSDGGKLRYSLSNFVNFAYQCASTFRSTDYSGGCNGARILEAPQWDWAVNKGLGEARSILSNVMKEVSERNEGSLSWADLIVFAGKVAIELAGGETLEFTAGRVDATDFSGSEKLAPRNYYRSDIVKIRDNMKIMGLSPQEMVALSARLRSAELQRSLGYTGSYTKYSNQLDNEYFKLLLNQKWSPVKKQPKIQVKGLEYQSIGKKEILYMTADDLALIWDPEFNAIVQDFASNKSRFKHYFVMGWQKLMNADMF